MSLFICFCFVVCQAGEVEVLSGVLKWGEQQLMKRMEEREPNLITHTAHSVSKKGIKKRDLNDMELREILSELLPQIRTDHIIPANNDVLNRSVSVHIVYILVQISHHFLPKCSSKDQIWDVFSVAINLMSIVSCLIQVNSDHSFFSNMLPLQQWHIWYNITKRWRCFSVPLSVVWWVCLLHIWLVMIVTQPPVPGYMASITECSSNRDFSLHTMRRSRSVPEASI